MTIHTGILKSLSRFNLLIFNISFVSYNQSFIHETAIPGVKSSRMIAAK
jgi:hypothetical protein